MLPQAVENWNAQIEYHSEQGKAVRAVERRLEQMWGTRHSSNSATNFSPISSQSYCNLFALSLCDGLRLSACVSVLILSDRAS